MCQSWRSLFFLFQHHIAAIVRLFPPFFCCCFFHHHDLGLLWGGRGGVKIEVDGLTGLLKAVLDSGRSLIGRRYFRTASNVFRVSSSLSFRNHQLQLCGKRTPVISSPHISALYITWHIFIFLKNKDCNGWRCGGGGGGGDGSCIAEGR